MLFLVRRTIGMPAHVTSPSESPARMKTKSSGVRRRMHFLLTFASSCTMRSSVSVSGIVPLNRISIRFTRFPAAPKSLNVFQVFHENDA